MSIVRELEESSVDVGVTVGREVGMLVVGTADGIKLGAPDGCTLGTDVVGTEDGEPVADVQSLIDVEPFSDCGVAVGHKIQIKSLEPLYVPAAHSLHIPVSSAPLPAGQVVPH